jgi:hypothetical protein
MKSGTLTAPQGRERRVKKGNGWRKTRDFGGDRPAMPAELLELFDDVTRRGMRAFAAALDGEHEPSDVAAIRKLALRLLSRCQEAAVAAESANKEGARWADIRCMADPPHGPEGAALWLCAHAYEVLARVDRGDYNDEKDNKRADIREGVKSALYLALELVGAIPLQSRVEWRRVLREEQHELEGSPGPEPMPARGVAPLVRLVR